MIVGQAGLTGRSYLGDMFGAAPKIIEAPITYLKPPTCTYKVALLPTHS